MKPSSGAAPYSSPYDSPRALWLILIGFLLVWFYMLGARTLVPTDEGRYAEMAREMLVTGDWITPRLNAIKYFEKPPLQAWMNTITFALFGVGDWQARLWTGLCGLLGIALVGYTGKKVFSARIGIHAAVVLASSLLWAASSHFNSLDLGVAAMMAIALCGLLLSQRNGATATEQRNGMLLCWAGMALAVLSKGLIGVVLPGAVLVLYTFLARDWAIWRRLHLGKGLLLFFAIVCPWFILVALKNPEHPEFFFIHEHFQRFTSNVHKRNKPVTFFIPLLVLGILPWLGFLLQSLTTGVRNEGRGFQPKKMLLVWTIFIFVFFSASHSKLTGYILPIFPSLALLIAIQLEKASALTMKWAAGLLFVIGLAGLIGGLLAPAFLTVADRPPIEIALNLDIMHWVIAACALLIIGSFAAWFYAARQKDWSLMSMAIATYLAGQILMLGYEPWGYYRAGLNHLAAIQAELKPDTPIYSVGQYEQCLPFYLGRTMTLVEFPDELAFGLQQEPQLWLEKRADFVQLWRDKAAQQQAALALVNPRIYDDFVKLGVPMRVVAQNSKRVIISTLPGAAH